MKSFWNWLTFSRICLKLPTEKSNETSYWFWSNCVIQSWCNGYSLISMRPIYYFDTWVIIWHGNVPVFLKFAQICKKFAAFAHKIVFVIVSVVKLFRNNNKNNFLQICPNLQKYWNIAMSNDGSSIKIIDKFHGD